MKTILLPILIIISMPALCTAEDNILTIKNSLVTVQFEKPLKKVAEEALRIYPSVKEELETVFKTEILFKPTIVLIKDRRDFQEQISKRPVVAVAISGKNLIIIDNSNMKTYPFSLAVTLKHELCHLFLHEYVRETELPRWLNEGICQWTSDGMAEIMTGTNENLLEQATLSKRLMSLRSLSKTFPGDERYMYLAYEESKSIVEYIAREYGDNGIINLLDYIRDGYEPALAVQKALSVSMIELEDNWHDHLKTRTTWFIYLSRHLYQVLFAFTAVVLVYGFVKFQLRKSKYKDDDEFDIEHKE